jgi:3-hydroxyisobutyrate dehydrogenase-like beta-hydroxyacid dehydrogenase
MDVGFLGLGHMGKAIAINLIRAGHRLCVWNRSAAGARELADIGAQIAPEPSAAAHGEVLMTMLADDEALRTVLVNGRVLETAVPGLIHVNLATVSVALTRELAELERQRGIAYVAAPVFGRPEVAQSAKLNIVVAGSDAAVTKIEPLLAAIGQRTWRVGDLPEHASIVKLAGNFMIASAIETMGEAAALVRAHGVASGQFIEVLTSTLFASPVYQVYGRLLAEQRYEPAAFRLGLGLKDVRLALQAGEHAHVPLPFASVLRDHFLEAIALGAGEKDWSALAEVAARHAGLGNEAPQNSAGR